MSELEIQYFSLIFELVKYVPRERAQEIAALQIDDPKLHELRAKISNFEASFYERAVYDNLLNYLSTLSLIKAKCMERVSKE